MQQQRQLLLQWCRSTGIVLTLALVAIVAVLVAVDVVAVADGDELERLDGDSLSVQQLRQLLLQGNGVSVQQLSSCRGAGSQVRG